MKRIILIICFLTACCAVFAQSSGPEMKPVNKLSFDFVQTKISTMLADKIVATGCMSYEAPDAVRWEYKTPTQTVFDSKAGGKRSFKAYASLIKSIAGGNSLESDSNFDVSIQEQDKIWLVVMKPVRKDLKQLFISLKLSFAKADSVVKVIEIEERNGDRTIIECKNIKSE